MQAKSLKTPEQTDEMLARIEKGNFNTVFVNVFAYGHAYYDSTLLKKEPTISPGYNPLAYFIEQAQQKDIAVHAWLVAGPVGGREGRGPILTEHPEWSMVGPDGQQSTWLNYNRADVRAFIEDMAIDIVTHYDVAGIHFDYTRYPGEEWTFDPSTMQAFTAAYDQDVDILRYAELPAYATFSGNALSGVNTAQTLAMFDNGLPAILLNHYGAGETLIFNWDATTRKIAASSGILQRGIDYLSNESGGVYLFNAATNPDENTSPGFNRTVTWLQDMEIEAEEIGDNEIALLNHDSVIIMPNVYVISAQTTSELAEFVYQGGGIIFIDGPTSSIKDQNIQALTGMWSKSGHFDEKTFLTATVEHPLIPNSQRQMTLSDYQALEDQWTIFRKEGITQLLQQTYHHIKQINPDVLVTITVSADQEKLNNRYFLDWQKWLAEGYTDLIIPRAYIENDELLAPILADWQLPPGTPEKILFGLKAYTDQGGEVLAKTPARLLSEIEQTLQNNPNGMVIFDIDTMSDAILQALEDQ